MAIKQAQQTTLEVPCEYPGCTNQIDIRDLFVDPTSGQRWCDKHLEVCNNCETRMLPGQGISRTRYNRTRHYCPECYGKLFATCPNCKEEVERQELLPPTRANTYSMKQGGCTECSTKCNSCERVVDKDHVYSEDNQEYCEGCYSEHFASCEHCGDTIDRDDAVYVPDVGGFCPDCYKKRFTACHECDDVIKKSDAHNIGDYEYCADCYKEIAAKAYKQHAQNLPSFDYTKKDRLLNLLAKHLPISVKELRIQYPKLAAGLGDLIAWTKGKPLTHELVQAYRNSLNPEQFPVAYTLWSGTQRSVEELPEMPVDQEQLVLNIVASPQMLGTLHANPALYQLFDNINTLSQQSEHPYVKDQIGWARLELDPDNQFVLVDEIQSDHSNAGFKLKHDSGGKIREIRNTLKANFDLNDEQLGALLNQYAQIVREFPSIANQAITQFARNNKFKQVFWHTLEGGAALKGNKPPKSLYVKVPQEHGFELMHPPQTTPFNLPAQFWQREATKAQNRLSKLARKLQLKYLIK